MSKTKTSSKSTIVILSLFSVGLIALAVWANIAYKTIEIYQRIGLILMAVVSAAITIRWALISRFKILYNTIHGIKILKEDEDAPLPSKAEFEDVTEQHILLWCTIPGFSRKRVEERLNGTKVWLKNGPFKGLDGEMKEGESRPLTKRVRFNVLHDSLDQTALRHELSHIISRLGDEELHKMMIKYGVNL